MFLAKLLLVAGALVTASLASPQLTGGPPKFDPPKRYYLALGDSVAYGYQQSKVDAELPPAAFDTGYVDDFAARLRQLRPMIVVVNYGCPRESTNSFIAGPCPLKALGFPGSARTATPTRATPATGRSRGSCGTPRTTAAGAERSSGHGSKVSSST